MKKFNFIFALGNFKTKSFFIFSFIYLFFSEASLIFAQDPNVPAGESTSLKNPINVSSIDELLGAILGFVIQLGIPVITVAIIYTGFKFVTARGNATKIEEAKRNLLYVLIGSAIILGAQALKILITGTVGEIQGAI